MKKIFTLLTSFLLSSSISPLTNLQTTINNNSETNDTSITTPLNFSFYKEGPISSGQTEDTKIISLVYYKAYASSWSDFTDKYSTLKLLNFNARSGGQGDTVSENSYDIKTKDIEFNKTITILDYDYHFIVCRQWSLLKFTFLNRNGMLMLSARFYTHSANAVYHVWISLSTTDAIFN